MNIFPSSAASSSDRMEESSETGAISAEIESQNGENDCECFLPLPLLSSPRKDEARKSKEKGEWIRKRGREGEDGEGWWRKRGARGRGTKTDYRGDRERRNAFLGELIPGVWNGWQFHGSVPSTPLPRTRARSLVRAINAVGTRQSTHSYIIVVLRDRFHDS